MKISVIFIISISVIVISCTSEQFEIQNLNGNKIACMGHGGMGVGAIYPLNSYESIIQSLNSGVDGTEFDVQISKDSILVLFHDFDLSETTNNKGILNSLDWDELKYTRYTKTPFLNYSIVSSEELFNHIENLHDFIFTFDCKLYPNQESETFYDTFINTLTSIISKYKIEQNTRIESQSIIFLNKLKAKNPKLKLFIYPSTFDQGLKIALENQLTGITISTRDITKEQIKIAHDNNLEVAIWNTHTSSDNIEAVRKNPDYIQTDNVKHLLKLLK